MLKGRLGELCGGLQESQSRNQKKVMYEYNKAEILKVKLKLGTGNSLPTAMVASKVGPDIL